MEEEEPVSIESTTNESTIEVNKDDDDKDIQQEQQDQSVLIESVTTQETNQNDIQVQKEVQINNIDKDEISNNTTTNVGTVESTNGITTTVIVDKHNGETKIVTQQSLLDDRTRTGFSVGDSVTI